MKRTRPKGDPDPGWVRISWDEALDTVAGEMRRLAAQSGPESVAFAITTPSGTAISDSIQWVERLMHAFGSPNNCYGTEICNWHKDVATTYTYGTSIGTPDWEHAGCALLWGHNPGASWIAQARQVADARARGAKLVVVDPRRAGAANKADLWLRVRPGTDGALALGIARVVLEEGWYDRDFVRDLTNAPFLVHCNRRRRLLRESDLVAGGAPDRFVVVEHGVPERARGRACAGAAARRTVGARRRDDGARPSTARSAAGTVLDAYRERCAAFAGEALEAITGVARRRCPGRGPDAHPLRPRRLLRLVRGRAAHQRDPDRPRHLLPLRADRQPRAPGRQRPVREGPGARRLGARARDRCAAGEDAGSRAERPLGPPKDGWCTSEDLYRAIVTGRPYPIRGLVAFGTNLLVSHAGTAAGMRALEKLDFHVHADIFPNPSAEYADILLPVNTPWEREALRVGFEITQAANGRVQLRPPAVTSRGESRDDGWIAFALAERLGLGHLFWNGDRDAGYREWLAPSGIALDALRNRNPRVSTWRSKRRTESTSGRASRPRPAASRSGPRPSARTATRIARLRAAGSRARARDPTSRRAIPWC